MGKYSIGIDLGTKSIRSVLVDIYTGEEINTSVSYYKKGILDSSFFDSNLYKSDMAIEDPLDYEESLFNKKNPPKIVLAKLKNNAGIAGSVL